MEPRHLLGISLLALGCDSVRLSGELDDYGSAPTDGAAFDASTFDSGIPGFDEGPGQVEDPFSFLRPAETERHLFVANAERATVTRVTVETLEVVTTPVGNSPQQVEWVPDQDQIAVFNHGDDTVSLIDIETLDGSTIDVRPGMNHLQVAPDGAFAAAWNDTSRPANIKPSGGLASFNEFSLIDIAARTHWPLVAGFLPTDVAFSPDGSKLVLVEDAFAAIVDLSLDTPAPLLVPLDTSGTPKQVEEMALTEDGAWAFVRRLEGSDLQVIDLAQGDATTLSVGNNTTDLDLSEDGTQAIVVAQDDEELWVFDAHDPFAAPGVIPLPSGFSFGSIELSDDGTIGVLYNTSIDTDRYAVWDRANDTFEIHALVKPIAQVEIAPSSDAMVVFHPPNDLPDADPNSPFFGNWAATVVSLEDSRHNPLLLPAPPMGFAHSPTGQFGYLTMVDQPFVELLDYTTLLHEEFSLSSTPVHVGVFRVSGEAAPEPLAWISQEHSLGRMSFLDPRLRSIETLTGFELNGQVED